MNERLLADTATSEPAPPPTKVREPRKTLVALRIIGVLHLVVFFLQPVLAGIYLSGDFDAIGLHELNGQIVTIVAGAQLIASWIYAWRGGGRWWPLIASFVLVLLEETQKGLGYERVVEVHVPFGITLLVVQLLLTLWFFGPKARLPRVRKPRKARKP